MLLRNGKIVGSSSAAAMEDDPSSNSPGSNEAQGHRTSSSLSADSPRSNNSGYSEPARADGLSLMDPTDTRYVHHPMPAYIDDGIGSNPSTGHCNHHSYAPSVSGNPFASTNGIQTAHFPDYDQTDHGSRTSNPLPRTRTRTRTWNSHLLNGTQGSDIPDYSHTSSSMPLQVPMHSQATALSATQGSYFPLHLSTASQVPLVQSQQYPGPYSSHPHDDNPYQTDAPPWSPGAASSELQNRRHSLLSERPVTDSSGRTGHSYNEPEELDKMQQDLAELQQQERSLSPRHRRDHGLRDRTHSHGSSHQQRHDRQGAMQNADGTTVWRSSGRRTRTSNRDRQEEPHEDEADYKRGGRDSDDGDDDKSKRKRKRHSPPTLVHKRRHRRRDGDRDRDGEKDGHSRRTGTSMA